MQLIRELPAFSDAATAVAIGNFDGLHLGHQAVLRAMREAAVAGGLVPSVLTFEPHPRRFFAPESPAFRLERVSTKLARLTAAGVERVYMPRFDAAFAALRAEAFLEDVLAGALGAKAVVTGENFAFGKGRGGDIATLRAWGREKGAEIISVPPVRFGEAVCSSSAIRAELALGDVKAAGHLLGRAYSLSGRVVHGDGRGKGIGFPTANVSLPPVLKLPRFGVYAVKVAIFDGGIAPMPPDAARRLGMEPYAAGSDALESVIATFNGVANLGLKPTMAVNNVPTLEVHLFDFERELYGKKAVVTFVDYIRPEQKFSGVDALVAQIGKDCEAARERLSGA